MTRRSESPTVIQTRDGSHVQLSGRGGTVLAPASPATPPQPPPAGGRARRRPAWFAPILLILVLGLLAALLVLGDSLGRRWTEGMIAERVRDELGLSAAPAVTVEGTPFLTQVAAQRLDAVHVVSAETTVAVAGRPVTLRGVDLWLRGVTERDNFAQITVADLAGRGQLGWTSVAQVIGTEITWSGKDDQGRGRIALRHNLEFQGLSVPITLTGRPVINAATHQLSFAEPTVAISGITLPADLVADLLTRNLKPIDLPLPPGLAVTEVTAEEAGLTVVLTGTDVVFTAP